MKPLEVFKSFIIPKAKFATTSAIATALDYGIYILLTTVFLTSETTSHAVSYTCGMILNFILQRRFIFLLKRKLYHAFLLSVGFSLIGWLLSQGIFNGLIFSFAFFKQHDILAKVIVTLTVFFYNFYTKRFAFERKYPHDNIRNYLKKD
ncbi:MAG: GtrA family protein [Bacteroidales bacterium]|nr:GtrA family protein [Bacteroidales bacterium]